MNESITIKRAVIRSKEEINAMMLKDPKVSWDEHETKWGDYFVIDMQDKCGDVVKDVSVFIRKDNIPCIRYGCWNWDLRWLKDIEFNLTRKIFYNIKFKSPFTVIKSLVPQAFNGELYTGGVENGWADAFVERMVQYCGDFVTGTYEVEEKYGHKYINCKGFCWDLRWLNILKKETFGSTDYIKTFTIKSATEILKMTNALKSDDIRFTEDSYDPYIYDHTGTRYLSNSILKLISQYYFDDSFKDSDPVCDLSAEEKYVTYYGRKFPLDYFDYDIAEEPLPIPSFIKPFIAVSEESPEESFYGSYLEEVPVAVAVIEGYALESLKENYSDSTIEILAARVKDVDEIMKNCISDPDYVFAHVGLVAGTVYSDKVEALAGQVLTLTQENSSVESYSIGSDYLAVIIEGARISFDLSWIEFKVKVSLP